MPRHHLKEVVILSGAVVHASGDARFEERADSEIVNPTDAVIRTEATALLTLPGSGK